MKYAAAVLLGLATVNANNAAPQKVVDITKAINDIFDGSSTLFNQGPITITETRNWEFDYGTYYTASTDATMHYENYGAYIESYLSANLNFDFTYYNFDITFTLYPFYLAPIDAWFSFERYMGTNNPSYTFTASSVSQILYFDTSYTEQVFVDTTSLKSWALGNTNNWYPASGDWAYSGTSDSYTTTDPYWSYDLFQILIDQGIIPANNIYGTYGIYTTTFQLF